MDQEVDKICDENDDSDLPFSPPTTTELIVGKRDFWSMASHALSFIEELSS